MADLINSRLFARVERSLRKRMNIDVRPHLIRCASHASTEDEFMSSAARLLINMHERQEWLASWAIRWENDGDESTAGDLDSTPAALDGPMHRSFRITPAQRDRVRDALARELGPIAALLIENESHRADSVFELLERLEAHLESEDQRTRFRNSTMSSKLQPDL